MGIDRWGMKKVWKKAYLGLAIRGDRSYLWIVIAGWSAGDRIAAYGGLTSEDIIMSNTQTMGLGALKLEIPAPYIAGHVLNAREAAVLNQTFSENIRNRFRASLEKAIEAAGGTLEGEKLDAFISEVQTYAKDYRFNSTRGPRAEKTDEQVRDEAITAVLKDRLVETGKTMPVGRNAAETIVKMKAKIVEKYPDLVERKIAEIKAKTVKSVSRTASEDDI